MKNILFIAPPSGGKGTHSSRLKDEYGYVHISTGDLLREVDKTSELGIRVNELISKGKFVDDETVIALLKEKLLTLKEDEHFILDGFPRNLVQAEELKDLLSGINKTLDIVIELDVPYDVCLKRVVGRVSCPNCKSIYNKFFMKPETEDICDKCNTKLVSRSDDNEETYKDRYDTYMNQTSPLIDYYKDKNLLVTIDGVNDTFDKIVSVIKND